VAQNSDEVAITLAAEARGRLLTGKVDDSFEDDCVHAAVRVLPRRKGDGLGRLRAVGLKTRSANKTARPGLIIPARPSPRRGL
jgi:hypothetical protein